MKIAESVRTLLDEMVSTDGERERSRISNPRLRNVLAFTGATCGGLDADDFFIFGYPEVKSVVILTPATLMVTDSDGTISHVLNEFERMEIKQEQSRDRNTSETFNLSVNDHKSPRGPIFQWRSQTPAQEYLDNSPHQAEWMAQDFETFKRLTTALLARLGLRCSNGPDGL